MTELYPSSTAEPPRSATVAPRTWLLLTLLAAVLLERLASTGIHLALASARLESVAPARIGQLLSNLTLLEELPLLLCGWLIDTRWGARRAMLIGAGLLAAAYLGLAVQADMLHEALQAGGPWYRGLYLVLGLKGLGTALLMPGLLVLATRLDSPGSARIIITFLLMRLMGGAAGMLLPATLGIVLSNFANWLLIIGSILAVVAVLLGAVLVWGRWPAALSPAETGRFNMAHLGWLLGLLVLGLSVGVYMPLIGFDYKLGAVLLLFGGGLGYLWWRSYAAATGSRLPFVVLVVCVAPLLTNLGNGLGYGINTSAPDAGRQVLLGGAIVLLSLLLLQWWARRRAADAAKASRRLWRASWLLTGIGLLLIVALDAPRLVAVFAGRPDFIEGPPIILPLEIGSTGLVFLLPVLISQRAPAHLLGRYLALSLMVAEVAHLLANLVLKNLYV